jgi:ketosteroid isomerase-like protein
MSKGLRSKQLFTSAEAAAAAFYEAFEARDVEAMMSVWAEDEEIVCVHPGGQRLVGYEAVRASWEQLFGGGAKLSFHLDQQVMVETVGLAMQSVIEYVSVDDDPAARGAAVATNVYMRTPVGWRLVVHHASQAPAAMPTAHPPGPLH